MRRLVLSALTMALFLPLYFLFLPWACAAGQEGMALESPEFDPGGKIPKRYTCEGEDVSPPLVWDSVPKGARSLVLICDDPDAPAGTWVHWVYYNIPVHEKGLAEGIDPVETPGIGGRQGINDFGNTGYGGPCPPPGHAHRYYFKLYALDAELNLAPGADKAKVLEEMKNHVITSTSLMGQFKR